ncbi:CHAT domain-containing protein [Streptomyces abyssomicinicus]|uniref:CHAT domain-containing protein n=1 Tax=Streptomyces abyssomicinicus TaxID=574929 RepID=UPI00124FAF19|nr:CHAT domain-containing protein [Streptomyces abyssomicinicus]
MAGPQDRRTVLRYMREALAHFETWQRSHDPRAVRTAVTLWATAVEELPPGSWERPSCLTELGRSLRGWFQVTGDPRVLDQAVEVSAAAVRESETLDGLFLDEILSNLALARWERYRNGHRMPDLEAAIAAGRRSLAATAAGDERRPSRRGNLSQMLMMRCQRTGSPVHLAEALDATRDAVEDAPPGHPAAAPHRMHLSELLRAVYTETRDAAALEESVEAARSAIALSRPGDPVRVPAWGSLALGLYHKVLTARQGDPDADADVEELILAAGHAVEEGGPADEGHPLHLLCLADGLLRRDGIADGQSDLDRGIAVCERFLTDHPGHDRHPYMRTQLAAALLERHGRTNDTRDLRRAADITRRAVLALPESSTDLPRLLCLRAVALLTLYGEHTARASDLDEAAEAARRGLGLRPGGGETDLLRATCAEILRSRFEDRGDPSDLEAATEAAAAAARDTPVDATHRPTVLNAVGGVLRVRAQYTGDRAVFTAAVDTAREAVRCARPDRLERALALNTLGAALHARYEHGGALDDLDAAVDAKRAATQAPELTVAHRAMCLSGLGHSLLTRYQRTGDVADLAAAVDACAEAVGAVATDHPAQDRFLANLSLALAVSHQRHGRRADLDEAVLTARRAVEVTPRASHRRPMNLCNLAIVTQDRFDVSDDRDDLEAAITAVREAVAVAAGNHPDQAKFLSSLGEMLLRRHELLGREQDLEEALRTCRPAVDQCPVDHEIRAGCLALLGDALTRAGRTGEAVDAFREAARLPTGRLPVRLKAAVAWGASAAADERWEEADQAYGYAVELLPQAAWHGLERGDRERFLAMANGLASDAAAVAVRRGDLPRAVELLEQGRGVLLGQAFDARADLDELRALDADLVRAMDEVRHRLDGAGAAGASPDAPGVPAGRAALAAVESQRRREAAAEWDRLLDRARALVPNFLRPLPYARLREAARGGPVVVVNISRHRCDALLVSDTSEAPLLVPLERISRPVVTARARELVGLFRGSGADAPHGTNDALRSLLAWLWRDVAEPVLAGLGLPDRPAEGEEPRLWWCPTGPLALLPLHAAGEYPAPGGRPPHGDAPTGTPGASLLDRAVCSYAPTLRALLEAGDRPAPGTPAVLGVAVPGAPGMPQLRHATAEIDRLRERFPAVTAVLGRRADRSTVLDLVRSHSWLHFAGHGSQHSPAGAALHCADDVIGLRDLTALRLTAAELAFLSACETAGGVAHLADEFAHLAGGLHIAGFRHVIATQWPISDYRAPQVAGDFYRALDSAPRAADGTLPAARALRHAVRGLRGARPDAPALWAAYLHTGP